MKKGNFFGKELLVVLFALVAVASFVGCPDSGVAADAPQDLKAEVVNDSSVKLTWKAPSDGKAKTYNVYWSEKTIGKVADVASGMKKTGVTELTHTVTGLTANTMYYFVVTAVNDASKEGSKSTEVKATPKSN